MAVNISVFRVDRENTPPICAKIMEAPITIEGYGHTAEEALGELVSACRRYLPDMVKVLSLMRSVAQIDVAITAIEPKEDTP